VCCPHCHCEDLKKLKRVPRRRRVKKLKRKGCYDCRWCKEWFTVRTVNRVSAVAHPAQRVAVCDLHVGDRTKAIQQPGLHFPAPCQRVCSTSGHRIPKSEWSELSTRPRFFPSTAKASPAPEAHAPVNGPAAARRAASPQRQPVPPRTSAAGSASAPERSALRH